MSRPDCAPRVVAAVAAELQPRLRALLPECALSFVASGSELVRALDEAACAMLIVEVHFDQAGAVAALRCALARTETFPVVCVRDLAARQPGYVELDELRMALGTAVASQFIDLFAHRDDDVGNAYVRGALMRLL